MNLYGVKKSRAPASLQVGRAYGSFVSNALEE
jgi:hypothetical protein